MEAELKASDLNRGHMQTALCDNRNMVSLVFSPKRGFMRTMAWRPAENGQDLFIETALGRKKQGYVGDMLSSLTTIYVPLQQHLIFGSSCWHSYC